MINFIKTWWRDLLIPVVLAATGFTLFLGVWGLLV